MPDAVAPLPQNTMSISVGVELQTYGSPSIIHPLSRFATQAKMDDLAVTGSARTLCCSPPPATETVNSRKASNSPPPRSNRNQPPVGDGATECYARGNTAETSHVYGAKLTR